MPDAGFGLAEPIPKNLFINSPLSTEREGKGEGVFIRCEK